ncbi:hypothetical protein Tco_0397674 [Tanacetum coccineum]
MSDEGVKIYKEPVVLGGPGGRFAITACTHLWQLMVNRPAAKLSGKAISLVTASAETLLDGTLKLTVPVHKPGDDDDELPTAEIRSDKCFMFLNLQAYTSQIVVMAMMALAIGADIVSTEQRREDIIESLINLLGISILVLISSGNFDSF